MRWSRRSALRAQRDINWTMMELNAFQNVHLRVLRLSVILPSVNWPGKQMPDLGVMKDLSIGGIESVDVDASQVSQLLLALMCCVKREINALIHRWVQSVFLKAVLAQHAVEQRKNVRMATNAYLAHV